MMTHEEEEIDRLRKALDAVRTERDAALTGCVLTTVVDPVGGPVAAPCAIEGCQYARAEQAEATLAAMAEANQIVRLSFAGAVRHADDRAARAESTLAAIWLSDAHRWELEHLRKQLATEQIGHQNFPLLQAIDAVLALLDAAPKDTP